MNNRNKRKNIANETVRILENGFYVCENQQINIDTTLGDCIQNTKVYTPELLDRMELPVSRFDTDVEVTQETTLAAGYRLRQSSDKVLVLNFASAKNPGGGFLGGSQAQEESLARASGLYGTLLTANLYYDTNRKCGTCLYTDHMIYSPNVPVFRDGDDELLKESYSLSMVTAPAVNYGALKDFEKVKAFGVMKNRIRNLLKLCASLQYEYLVLGAWGCGVFQNDPEKIARMFHDEIIQGDFNGVFKRVTFAIYSRDSKFINAFDSVLSKKEGSKE